MSELIRFALRCVVYALAIGLFILTAPVLVPAAALVMLFDWAYDNEYWNHGWKKLIKQEGE